MNLKNSQDKSIVEVEILQPELTGKDELKRSIKKEVAISSIMLRKGEVDFYHHPFPRDVYEEIFIPTHPYYPTTLRNISGRTIIAFVIFGYRKKSCTTSLNYKSHNQPEKIIEHFVISNFRPAERFRSACLMDSGVSFRAYFTQRNESPWNETVGMTVKIVEFYENYFAEPGFQTLAQARHKFPLEMSGYKNIWRNIMAKKLFNKVHFSSQTVEWPTPQGLFDELNGDFGFTLDPCATHENAKCKKYFTKEDDGLKHDWGKEIVFMNPPYRRGVTIKWMKKAYASSLKGATVVCLVPARTDTRWWHDYSMKASEIKFVKGRLKFGNSKNSAPFPSALVIFRPLKDKEKDISNNRLLEKTQEICMPAIKTKMDITDLLAFNLAGNKSELLSDNIGSLVEIGAKNSDRIIDAFAGTGAYIHYLRDSGIDKPMILNEFDPFRFVTHKQIKDNPLSVSFAVKYYQEKVSNKVKHLKHGDPFDSVAKEARKNVVDYMQKEADRLIQPWQKIIELKGHKLPLKMKNTPELASLYIVMQNQRHKYYPINADISVKGLKQVMTYGQNKTVTNEKGKIKLFRTGGRILLNPRERILSVSKRLKNVEIKYGDGWKLINETARDGDFVLVDTSYFGKKTENYNQFTREDSDPSVYMNKIRKYILPAWRRGAKFLITNDWNDEIVTEFRQMGFSVFKAERAKMQSKGKPELIAINFNPIAGILNPIGKLSDIDSYAGIKKAA